MKYDALKKYGNKWVRIRPALQIYNDSGVMTHPAVEDAWFLSEITDKSARLQSREARHFKVVALDHIHHYMDDAERAPDGITTGVLVMNVQLLIHQGELLVEPVAPPGSSLKAFIRAWPRATLLAAAAQKRASQELAEARKKYLWTPAGVEASIAEFWNFIPVFFKIRDELTDAGQPIELLVRRGHELVFIMYAAGCWVSFRWQPKAVNCIENSFLTVTLWDGEPAQHGYYIPVISPGIIFEERYSWGLVALNQPRWISENAEGESYDTEGLATQILTKLLNQ